MVGCGGYFHPSTLEGTLSKLAQSVLPLMVSVHQDSTVGNWVYLADYDSKDILHVGSHLACFYGGNWILGRLGMLAVVMGLTLM